MSELKSSFWPVGGKWPTEDEREAMFRGNMTTWFEWDANDPLWQSLVECIGHHFRDDDSDENDA